MTSSFREKVRNANPYAAPWKQLPLPSGERRDRIARIHPRILAKNLKERE
jgi:hypothetical protein